MRLSMSMIAWYMRDYAPDISINDDGLTVRGLRFLSEDSTGFPPEYIYFGRAENYFSDAAYKEAYIVVNKKNWLLFRSSDYEELLNALLSSFDYFNDWEGRMVEVVSRKGAMQEILDIAWEVFENPAVVGDSFENFYAVSAPGEVQNEPYWDYMIQNRRIHPLVAGLTFNDTKGNPIEDLTNEPKLVENIYEGGPPVVMLYLMQDGQPVACYSILQTHQERIRLNLQLASKVAGYLLMCGEFTSAKPLIRSDEAVFKRLLEKTSLLESTSEDADIETGFALRIGARIGAGRWRLAAFCQTMHGNSINKIVLLNRIKGIPEIVLPVLTGDVVYALVSDENAGKMEQIIAGKAFLGRTAVGLSMISTDMFSLPACRRQALFALEKSDGNEGVFRCEDYAFSFLLEKLAGAESAREFAHPAIAALEEYDMKKGMELKSTLSAFLDCSLSIEKTSRYMNVHKSTLKYRVKRIEELTGIDFEDAKELRWLRLSDWIWE